VNRVRVVVQRVDGPEAAGRRLGQLVHVILDGQVGGLGQHCAACRFDLGRHGLDAVGVQVRRDHSRAPAGAQQRRRAAHPRRGAGYDHHLAVQRADWVLGRHR